MGDLKKTCIIYCRTSTHGQRDAETIQAQVERCQRLVERYDLKLLKYGKKRDGWVLDDGVSGTLLDGRNFAGLLDDLRAKKVRPDFIVMFSLSRLSRVDRVTKDMDRLDASHQAAARIQATLIGTGTMVLDEDGPCDPAGLSFQLKSMMANEEFKMIRSRTMAGKARHLREGRWAMGGRTLYGYQPVFCNGVNRTGGYKLMPHPDNATRVQQILQWYVEGGSTHAARLADTAKYPTPHRLATSKKWCPFSVRHIADRAHHYLGEQTLTFDGQPHTIKYPPLIDAKLLAAVERRRKERVLKKRADLLATGFAVCGCGAHVRARNSNWVHYTVCSKRCGSMPERKFSAVLWAATVCRLVQIAQNERTASTGPDALSAQLKAAKANVAQVSAEIGRLLDVYLSAGLEKADWKAKNDPLNERRATAQAEVDRLVQARADHERRKLNEQTVEARVQAVLRELGRSRQHVTLERKRQVLADLLQGERVTVTWAKDYVALTLPAFGGLKAVTVRSDRDVWLQMEGITRDVMDLYYRTEDAVEEVGVA